MKTFRRIALVALLSGIAIAYLSVHNWSLRVTRELDAAEAEHRLCTERVLALETELETLTGFGRIESLWVVSGRPCYQPAPSVPSLAEGQIAQARETPASGTQIALADRGRTGR